MLLERDPVIMKVASTWLTLVTGGGPTDDKLDQAAPARHTVVLPIPAAPSSTRPHGPEGSA